jgi:hypothetical protein
LIWLTICGVVGFSALALRKEILGGAELPLGHHDGTKLQEGCSLVLLVGQSLAEGLPDIAFCLPDIVLLHAQHPHLQQAGAFRLFHRHSQVQSLFHVLFRPVKSCFIMAILPFNV